MIRELNGIKIVHVTAEVEDGAWEIFKTYNDKDFSFTDSASFYLMKELKIQNAFTFDNHFSQLGFNRLPK